MRKATHRWRSAVAAAVLSLLATSSPASGVLAAELDLAHSSMVGGTLDRASIAALDSQPATRRPAALSAFARFDVLVAAPLVPYAPTLARATSPASRTSDPASPVRVGAQEAVPTDAPAAVPAAVQPTTMWAQLRDGLTVIGMASWYPGTGGYVGIAHVAMPGARYLPPGAAARRVRVCVDGRCLVVPVVDACDCHVGTSRARIVDLSAATLSRLGLDPAHGIFRVQVALVGR